MIFNIHSHPKAHIAVIDGEVTYTYGALVEAVDALATRLAESDEKKLYFIQAANSFTSLVHYLAVLSAGHCAMLLNPSLAQAPLQALLSCYKPGGLLSETGLQTFAQSEYPIADELALLLSTSGSSGAPKQVALSYANLRANAQSICQYLPVEATHNALANLPMHYAYGLSVINTHLLMGATLVFTDHTPVNREFWTLLETLPVHSLAGVPHSYEMLIRLGLTRKALPDLCYFTQAGGKLKERWVKHMHEYCTEHNKAFYVMYGQTEATARMGWLAPEKLADKPGAIGQAIPGGEFALAHSSTGDTIRAPYAVGELRFRGPNVMLGYVNGQDDLQCFNPVEWLHTGDLAQRDDEGDYSIVGRLKRIIKIHGQRISLDATETLLSERTDAEVVCIGGDDRLTILSNQALSHSQKTIAQWLHVHPSSVHVTAPATLLYNDNGKLDYPAMQERYHG